MDENANQVAALAAETREQIGEAVCQVENVAEFLRRMMDRADSLEAAAKRCARGEDAVSLARRKDDA